MERGFERAVVLTETVAESGLSRSQSAPRSFRSVIPAQAHAAKPHPEGDLFQRSLWCDYWKDPC